VREWIRSHLTYANVMATLAVFLVLGGISYAASGGKFILGQSNTATSKSTLSAPIADKALTVTNNSANPGATALGLNVAKGHPPFRVNSGTKVANLNADQIDGQNSTAFGQVRQFSHTIAAASAGPPQFEMVTFHGLTLSSQGNIFAGPQLQCTLYAKSPDAGEFDATDSTNRSAGITSTHGSNTPITNWVVADAYGDDTRTVGQLVFRDADTGRVLTVAYSIHVLPYFGDINGSGCTWQGTITASG
jgi:hypothetical protein